MMKKICFLILFLLLAKSALASAPIGVNNKFGMHLAVPSHEDLNAAVKLINSNGGEWGYVTLVIADNDLDVKKWQAVFDQLRELQLIPIVRLATHADGENWVAADPKDSQKWLQFLNSLNWVVKNRYVILFNEPNHASEWGGAVDFENYAEVALEFGKTLKNSNENYFLMLAGLDQAAPQQLPHYAEAGWFIEKIITAIGPANFEKYFDGWCSHSYPNPGFSGSPQERGWGSIGGYEAELALLENLGIEKQLPVFITETGWQGEVLDEETVADYYVSAFNSLWLPDTRVAAVTPFIFNYQSEPFLGFSWQKPNSQAFYQQYEAVLGLNKVSGRPEIEENIGFLNRLPEKLVEDSSFLMKLTISNLGQGYWDAERGYELRLVSAKDYYYRAGALSKIAPGQTATVDFEFHTPKQLGASRLKIGLFHNDEKTAESNWWRIKIMPLQKLTLHYRLLSFTNSGSDFRVLIYDQDENLVHETGFVSGQEGKIKINNIHNIALGEKYRVVLLKPGYLPRQTFVVFGKGQDEAKFKLMWPLDWNYDGAWTFSDLKALFSLGNPNN